MIDPPLHIFVFFCFSHVSFSVFLPYTPSQFLCFWDQRYPFLIFIITSIMSAGQEGKSLSERIETPSISKDAAKKIALLEQEFISADVEQCMFFISILRCYGLVMYMLTKLQCAGPFPSCAPCTRSETRSSPPPRSRMTSGSVFSPTRPLRSMSMSCPPTPPSWALL